MRMSLPSPCLQHKGTYIVLYVVCMYSDIADSIMEDGRSVLLGERMQVRLGFVFKANWWIGCNEEKDSEVLSKRNIAH